MVHISVLFLDSRPEEDYDSNTKGYLKFRGHGFLDCTNGIYDFNFKTKTTMTPLFFNYYFLKFKKTIISVKNPNHLPGQFLYTHGTFNVPLPANVDYVDGLCGEVKLGNNIFLDIWWFIKVKPPFWIKGTSYP